MLEMDKYHGYKGSMNSTKLLRCVACLSFLILTIDCHAQEWDRFHGPNGSGVSLESDVPSTWTKDDYAENMMMVALDHDGTEVWKRDFGRWVSQHGFGGSPLVYKDLLIFCNSQQADKLPAGKKPGQSRMMAVNKLTGEDVWERDLTTKRVCYAMPVIYSVEGEPDQLINCNTGDGFYSLNPETGEVNWKKLPFKKRTIASTLLVDDMIFGSSGSGGGGNLLVAAKIGAAGEAPDKVFEVKRNANYVPSPVAVGDLLFLFGDRGVVSCVDAISGQEHWRERVGRGFSGSPVATSTHVYCIDQQGVCHVVAAEPEFEKTASVDLGEPSRSTPAIVGNQMLLRTDSHLMSLKGSDQ